jgi:hypothetical protein
MLADAVDVLEGEEDLLLVRNVDTRDTWHAEAPLTLELGPSRPWVGGPMR